MAPSGGIHLSASRTAPSGGITPCYQGYQGSETGRACGRPLDKTGRIVEIHPDTGFDLRELVVPLMPEAWAMCAQVQRAFPYYRMLGLDVAIGETGPILLEINAYPDLAGFESHAGPFLAEREVLFEFDRAGALTSSMRRVLRDDLREAKRRAAGSETR